MVAEGMANASRKLQGRVPAGNVVVNCSERVLRLAVLRREGKPAMHGTTRRAARRFRFTLAISLCTLIVVSMGGVMVSPAAAHSIGAVGADFEPPTYTQQRNLSCEYASLVIAFSTYGVTVSEYAFDDLVGWSENPHLGFRGDINGNWGNTTDYGR